MENCDATSWPDAFGLSVICICLTVVAVVFIRNRYRP